MSTRRKFNFPLATLIRSAEILGSALIDPAHQAAMTARLGAAFIAAFPGKIHTVASGADAQSSQTGDLSQLTAAQLESYREMERLAAGARRTARLAFRGQNTVLGAEFQVGEAGSKSLSATIARARLTHTASVKHATALQAKGWIPADTAALRTAILGLAGVDTKQEEAKDDRQGFTNEKIIAANALYADCLTIQNAARLQYPGGNDSNGNAKNVTARAHFLLSEFPPRGRDKSEDPETPPPAA